MAHSSEPMDVDINAFDNKENAFHHSNVPPLAGRGREELDASEMNMKLRYSLSPVSSTMSKSYHVDVTSDAMNNSDIENCNLTHSFNVTTSKNDPLLKVPTTLPLQTIHTEHVEGIHKSILHPLDALQDHMNDSEDTLSLPSSSSSVSEATTPVKDLPKPTGSPIMRGLKSVLSMFRPSQSPTASSEHGELIQDDNPSLDGENLPTVLSEPVASTPIAVTRKDRDETRKCSPIKEKLVFKDDLERELQWKEDTTIIFSKEKIPIQKLFYQELKATDTPKGKDILLPTVENLDISVEPMDISYNTSIQHNKTTTLDSNISVSNNTTIDHGDEGESLFLDCETTFTENDKDMENNEQSCSSFNILKDNSYLCTKNNNTDAMNIKDHINYSNVKEETCTQNPIVFEENNLLQQVDHTENDATVQEEQKQSVMVDTKKSEKLEIELKPRLSTELMPVEAAIGLIETMPEITIVMKEENLQVQHYDHSENYVTVEEKQYSNSVVGVTEKSEKLEIKHDHNPVPELLPVETNIHSSDTMPDIPLRENNQMTDINDCIRVPENVIEDIHATASSPNRSNSHDNESNDSQISNTEMQQNLAFSDDQLPKHDVNKLADVSRNLIYSHQINDETISIPINEIDNSSNISLPLEDENNILTTANNVSMNYNIDLDSEHSNNIQRNDEVTEKPLESKENEALQIEITQQPSPNSNSCHEDIDLEIPELEKCTHIDNLSQISDTNSSMTEVAVDIDVCSNNQNGSVLESTISDMTENVTGETTVQNNNSNANTQLPHSMTENVKETETEENSSNITKPLSTDCKLLNDIGPPNLQNSLECESATIYCANDTNILDTTTTIDTISAAIESLTVANVDENTCVPDLIKDTESLINNKISALISSNDGDDKHEYKLENVEIAGETPLTDIENHMAPHTTCDTEKGHVVGKENKDNNELKEIDKNENADSNIVDEEVIASENNSPFVSLNAEITDISSLSPVNNEKPVETNELQATQENIQISPPISPKTGCYNFNFDEIVDPFATKTKIRITPVRSLDDTFAKEIKTENTFITESAVNTDITVVVSNSDVNEKPNANKEGKEEIEREIPENKPDIKRESMNDVVEQDLDLDRTVTLEIASQTKLSTLNTTNASSTNFTETMEIINTIQNKSKLGMSPSLDFDDTVAKKCELRQSSHPSIDEVTDTEYNPSIDQVRDTEYKDVSKIDVNKEQKESELSGTSKSSHFNNSNPSVGNDNTLCEVHTEDEDTMEGPFIETDLGEEKEDIFDVQNIEINQFTDIAQENEENCEGGEMFIDAEAFDFLMNQNQTSDGDGARESLFLKFDPLFTQRVNSDGVVDVLSKLQKHQSTPKKLRRFDMPKMAKSPAAGPPFRLHEEPSSESQDAAAGDVSTVASQKPTMIVPPAPNTEQTPRKSAATTNRISALTSPAMAVIDRLLSISANNSPAHNAEAPQTMPPPSESDIALMQLREALTEKEKHVQHLRTENGELRDRLDELEAQVTLLEAETEKRRLNVDELTEKLAEKEKVNKIMSELVEGYERTVGGLMARLEDERRAHAAERAQLATERDEQTSHLASMEVAFNDLHSKYEKSKQIIFTYKAQEDERKKSVEEAEENMLKMQSNYEQLKQHATTKLNFANQELEKINKAHEAEVLKMTAIMKRKDMTISSLEETLAQKTKANEELTAICDELINKVG